MDCQYQYVCIPECRRKTLYGTLRPHWGEVFRKLVAQRESRLEEGTCVRITCTCWIAIPPKYSVSQVGFITGKSAIRRGRVYGATCETSRSERLTYFKSPDLSGEM